MTWIADMSPWNYGRQRGSKRLLAIGWLEPDHEFERGRVPMRTIRRLGRIAAKSLDPYVFRGFQNCNFCGLQGLSDVVCGDDGVKVGAANFFVPSESEPRCVFAAPSMLVHYILDHGYKPPAPFLRAVDDCPDPLEPTFLSALLRHGPRRRAWGSSVLSAAAFENSYLDLGGALLRGNAAVVPFIATYLRSFKNGEDDYALRGAVECAAEIGETASPLIPALEACRAKVSERSRSRIDEAIEAIRGLGT